MLASLAPYLNPALWGDWLRASAHEIDATAFWVAVSQLVFIDILLSGDNAVVIAMACRGLPARQRLWGMIIGAGVAVILRVLFTGILARLLLLPYLKLVGGLALLYVAANLLVPEDDEKGELAAVAHLGRAIGIIVVADVVMSLDNIVAIAAIAQGNLLLLGFGLAASIPLILAGAALVMALIDRFPILVWAGAALLGWIAGEVIATDPVIVSRLTASFGAKLALQAEFAASGAGALLAVGAGGLWRRLHEMHSRAAGMKRRAG
jgi:YjbE family integral membrane protein